MVIGLTGNIGTGKSSVLQMLAELGAQVIDADELAHEVMAPDGPAYAAVVETFGPDIVGPSQQIDRQRLGAIAFRYPQALAMLEAVVHPAVVDRTRQLIAEAEAEVVALEAIKLLESGLARELCDQIWVVTCRPEQQLLRVMAQRGLDEAEVRLRMEAQPPQEEKIAQAEVVIDNSGTIEETRAQVEAAWQALNVTRAEPEAAQDSEEAPTVVRPSTLEDAAGIVHVLNTIVREQRFTALDRELTLEEEREYLSRRGPREAIFVAERDGHIVGFQGVDPFMPAIGSMSHVAQMGTYVLPSCRGQGIGQQLFAASCDFARRQGYRKIVIYVRAGNSQAQAFYQRLGFEMAGRLRRQTRIGDDFEDEIFLETFLEEP
jgi:dephospho-CoA kinase